jgi:16S rRNA G966 N2-methylase RsmD
MEETIIKHVKASLDAAEYKFSKLSKEVINLPGDSGEKTRHFLNNLLQMRSAKFLEIGAGVGSLTSAALYNNCAKVFSIDNWYQSSKEPFMENHKKYKGNNYTRVIEQAYQHVDVTKLSKFNILLYDATIEYNDIYGTLPHFINCMEDVFVYIVDDINWRYIHYAAKKSIEDLKLTILYEKEIYLTDNDTHTPMNIAKESWWNGLYIVVLKKTPVEPENIKFTIEESK